MNIKKKKLKGGVGEDNHVGVFNDFIYTASIAKAYLWEEDLKMEKIKITIVSNQDLQDVCKKNITQFAFPKDPLDLDKILFANIEDRKWGAYFIPKLINLDFYWVNEFDWLMKLDWIEGWEIDNTLKNELMFKNQLGKIIFTGELMW